MFKGTTEQWVVLHLKMRKPANNHRQKLLSRCQGNQTLWQQPCVLKRGSIQKNPSR